MLEDVKDVLVVEYAPDIDTTEHGRYVMSYQLFLSYAHIFSRVISGFSINQADPYSRHPWNLNMLPHLASSLLHNVDGISG